MRQGQLAELTCATARRARMAAATSALSGSLAGRRMCRTSWRSGERNWRLFCS